MLALRRATMVPPFFSVGSGQAINSLLGIKQGATAMKRTIAIALLAASVTTAQAATLIDWLLNGLTQQHAMTTENLAQRFNSQMKMVPEEAVPAFCYNRLKTLFIVVITNEEMQACIDAAEAWQENARKNAAAAQAAAAEAAARDWP